MQARAVLLVTHDNALWEHWRGLESHQWLPARGRSLDELPGWREQGRRLVLLDADLPGLPAWNNTVWADYMRDLNVVVGTMRPSDAEAKEILSAGASGYAHAYSPPKALSTVLQTVSAGSVWMGPTLLARLLREIDRRAPRKETDWADGLTVREREVAERAAIGHSNQAIAEALHITERTVRAHMSAVFEKLGVEDRLMLALKVHGVQ